MSFKYLFTYCIPVVQLTHYHIYFLLVQEEKKIILLCTESLEAKYLSGTILSGRLIDIQKYIYKEEAESPNTTH